MPNIGLQGSHAIALGAFGNTPSVDNIKAAALRMGINEDQGQQIANQVLAVTSNWRDHMSAAEVSPSDLAILERCFG